MNRLFNCFKKLQEQGQRYRRDIFQKPRKGTVEDKVYNEERNFNIHARKQVNKMRENIAKNTPRIVAGLLIGSSSMWLDYTDTQFYQNIKKSIDYCNMKNAFFCSIIFGLQVVKYCDIKATKKALPPRGNVFMWLLLPIGLSFTTLSYWDVIDKKMLLGSYISDSALLLVETKLVNEALIPFWFFNLKYTIHIFDLIYLTCIYFSMKHLRNHIDTMPHKYIQKQQNEQGAVVPINSADNKIIEENQDKIKALPSILSLQKKL